MKTTTYLTGTDRRGDLFALRESVKDRTRTCPAVINGLAGATVVASATCAGSVAWRGCQQGGHRDIESLGHGSQVVDGPPRPATKPHGQRRLAQAHLGCQGLLTDTSAGHPGAHLCGHPQAQLVYCGLSHGSTIGGSLPPGTHPVGRPDAPSSDASSPESTGYYLIACFTGSTGISCSDVYQQHLSTSRTTTRPRGST